MRRIAELIDTADALGFLGLLVICLGVAQFDVRWVPIIIGTALLLLAIAYSRPTPSEAEAPAPAPERPEA